MRFDISKALLLVASGTCGLCLLMVAGGCSSSAPTPDSLLPADGALVDRGPSDLGVDASADSGSDTSDVGYGDSTMMDTMPLPDVGVDSAVDLGSPIPDLGNVVPGDTCYNPIPLVWQAGQASWKSSTYVQATSFVTLPKSTPTSCVDGDTSGEDLFFSIQVPADGRYLVRSVSTGGAVYVFENCADVVGSCVHQVPGRNSTSHARLVWLRGGRRYLVGIDRFFLSSVEILIEAAPVLSNDRCTTALPVSFTNGQAVLPYRLPFATDTNSAQTLTCPLGAFQSAPTQGSDLFFRVPMTAGKVYRAGGWLGHTYVIDDCTTPACVAGHFPGLDRSQWHNPEPALDPLLFRPQKSGDYIVVMDSGDNLGWQGQVILEERTPPPRDTCSGAETINASGSVKISGSFDGMHDDSHAPQGCPLNLSYPPQPSPTTYKDDVTADVYYRLKTQQGFKHRIVCTNCTFYYGRDCIAVQRRCQSDRVQAAKVEGNGSDLILRLEGKGSYTLDIDAVKIPAHGYCGTPLGLSWSGTTIERPLDFSAAVVTSSVGCHAPRAELYFSVPVKAGRRYGVRTRCVPRYGTGVHASWLTSCFGSPDCKPSACSGWSVLDPQKDGDALVIAWYEFGGKSPELVIEEAPEHTSCDRARSLGFVNGQVRVDDTRHAWFPVSPAPASCANPRSLYYSFAVKAGKKYTLSFDTSTRAALAMDAHSCAASASSLCSFSNMSGPKQYSAAANGTWLLRVDADAVAFTLSELP